MVNKALETFIIKFSLVVFLIGFVVSLLFLPRSIFLVLCEGGGYLISLGLFMSTASYFGRALSDSPEQKILQWLSLPLAFIILILALFLAMHFEMLYFWMLFGGIMVVPASVILYIVLEVIGVLHTNFYV